MNISAPKSRIAPPTSRAAVHTTTHKSFSDSLVDPKYEFSAPQFFDFNRSIDSDSNPDTWFDGRSSNCSGDFAILKNLSKIPLLSSTQSHLPSCKENTANAVKDASKSQPAKSVSSRMPPPVKKIQGPVLPSSVKPMPRRAKGFEVFSDTTHHKTEPINEQVPLSAGRLLRANETMHPPPKSENYHDFDKKTGIKRGVANKFKESQVSKKKLMLEKHKQMPGKVSKAVFCTGRTHKPLSNEEKTDPVEQEPSSRFADFQGSDRDINSQSCNVRGESNVMSARNKSKGSLVGDKQQKIINEATERKRHILVDGFHPLAKKQAASEIRRTIDTNATSDEAKGERTQENKSISDRIDELECDKPHNSSKSSTNSEKTSRSGSSSTRSVPFNLEVDKRGQKAEVELFNKIEHEYIQIAEKSKFRARPNLSAAAPPFRVHKSAKSSTRAKQVNLSTEKRIIERSQFKHMTLKKQEEAQQRREIMEFQEAERKKKEERQIRKQLVHKARPLKKAAPFKVHPSSVPPTIPASPSLRTKARSCKKPEHGALKKAHSWK